MFMASQTELKGKDIDVLDNDTIFMVVAFALGAFLLSVLVSIVVFFLFPPVFFYGMLPLFCFTLIFCCCSCGLECYNGLSE